MFSAPPLPAQRVACELDPDLFFERRYSAMEKARDLCQTCPLMYACLDNALANREFAGVRGGLTGAQRRRLYNDALSEDEQFEHRKSMTHWERECGARGCSRPTVGTSAYCSLPGHTNRSGYDASRNQTNPDRHVARRAREGVAA